MGRVRSQRRWRSGWSLGYASFMLVFASLGLLVAGSLVSDGLSRGDAGVAAAGVLSGLVAVVVALRVRRILGRNYVVVDPEARHIRVVTSGTVIEVPFENSVFAIPAQPGPRYVYLELAHGRVTCTMLTQAKLWRSPILEAFAAHLGRSGVSSYRFEDHPGESSHIGM